MKREFMIERQGRAFVLYAGLLDEAHQKGLKSVRTRLLQAPSPENGETTICLAEVELEDGRVFSGIGDANPHNVSRNIAPHAIRMAETRAKARALRDAVNVGTVALEELGDDELDAPASSPERRDVAPPLPRPAPANGGPRPTPITAPRPEPAARREPAGDRPDQATAAQVRAIYLIARDQHGLSDQDVDRRAVDMFGAAPAELSKRQASTLISSLKGDAQPAAS